LREYSVNGLLAATSSALLWFLGCIWVEGSHYIQEPNIIILAMETAGIATILGFAVYNLIRVIKRLTSYVTQDTAHSDPKDTEAGAMELKTKISD
jgi:hypothetical protein